MLKCFHVAVKKERLSHDLSVLSLSGYPQQIVSTLDSSSGTSQRTRALTTTAPELPSLVAPLLFIMAVLPPHVPMFLVTPMHLVAAAAPELPHLIAPLRLIMLLDLIMPLHPEYASLTMKHMLDGNDCVELIGHRWQLRQ